MKLRILALLSLVGMSYSAFAWDWKHRNGLLLWMSHSAWPCLVFQTYDYYYDVNGAYFGSKKFKPTVTVEMIK